MRFLLNATLWQNGSGLATLSHLLTQQLNSPNWHHFEKKPVFQKILKAFSTIYQIPDLDWRQVNWLLQSYLHPHDQQMLWLPPLRLVLKELLLANDDYCEQLQHRFIAVLKKHVIDDKILTLSEDLSIYRSNKNYFKTVKQQYVNGSPRLKLSREHRLFQIELLKKYWQKTGYTLYCHLVGKYKGAATELNTEELSIFCKALKINLSILKVAKETNKRISIGKNENFKGYLGSHSLGDLKALHARQYWSPTTKTKEKAQQHTVMWHGGTPQFISKNVAQMGKAVSQAIVNKKRPQNKSFYLKSTKLKKLGKAIAKNDFWFFQKGIGRKSIDKAIKNSDLRRLLTFSYFNQFARNYIIQKINGNNKFFNRFFFLDKTLKNIKHISFANWENTLNEAIPIVDSPRKDSLLHTLIRTNQNKKAIKAIKQGKDIHESNGHKITPVHLACARGKTKILKAMLAHKLKKGKNHIWYNLQDKNGENALHHAAKHSHAKTMALLLDKRNKLRADLSVTNKHGRTPLHVAARNPFSNVLKTLLAYSSLAVINQQDNWGMTALHYAVAIKSKKNVELLLASKADLSISAFPHKIKEKFPKLKKTISNKLTPLWLALEIHAIDLLAKLITNQNCLAIKNSENNQAAHLAVIYDRKDLLKKWFKKFDANYLLHYYKKPGQTLMHTAALAGNLDLFKYLLAKGGQLIALDHEGNTPLHCASMHGNNHLVRFICQKTKNAYQKNKVLNKTALKNRPIAGFINHKISKFSQRLWQSKQQLTVNVKNKYGETPYMQAAAHGHKKTVAILKRRGAKEYSVFGLFVKAIYSFSAKKPVSHQHALAQKTHREQRAAMLAARHQAVILNQTDKAGNTLLHLCVKMHQYRMLHILLHPLTAKQKATICAKTNRQGLTAHALVKQLQNNKKKINRHKKDFVKKLNSNQLVLCKKIERLLLRCDPKAYSTLSAREKASLYYKWIQDQREEIMSSTWYQNISSTMLVGMPLYRFSIETAQTGNPWLGLEAAISEIFNVDSLDWASRVLNYSNQYLPSQLQTPVSYAQSALYWAGMWRHTTNRLTVEGCRQLATSIMNHLPLLSDNYLTQLNYSGLIMYLMADMEGRYHLGPKISEYMPSLESYFSQAFGLPTFDEITDAIRETVNNKVNDVTGVNIAQSLRSGYQWARENIGRQPSLATIFQEQVSDSFMLEIGLADENMRAIIQQAAEKLFIRHYGDNNKVNLKLSALGFYANTGLINESTVGALVEAAQLLSSEGNNFAQQFAILATLTPFHQALNNETELNHRFEMELQTALNGIQCGDENIVPQVNQVLAQVTNNIVNAYACTRMGGVQAVNDYHNKLRPSNINPEISGRAEEVTWSLVANNPLYFANMTSDEIAAVTNTCMNYLSQIQGSQRDSQKQHDRRVADNYNTLNTLMISQLYVSAFVSGQPLDENTRFYFLSCDPIEVRAAFAVHETNMILSESTGYEPMNFAQQLNLYRELINVQHDNKVSKKEEAEFRSEIWNALQQNAIDWNNYQPLWGTHTLDEIADYVNDSSKLAGENHWQDTSDDLTRPIHRSQGTVKRVINSIQKRVESTVLPVLALGGGVLGLGAMTNGRNPEFGVMNLPEGVMTNMAYQFGQMPPAQYSSTSAMHFSAPQDDNVELDPELIRIGNKVAWQVVQEKFPQQHPTSVMAWLDNAWDEFLRAPVWHIDENEYVNAFAQACEQNKQEQKLTSKANTTKQSKTAASSATPAKQPVAQNTTLACAAPAAGASRLTQLGMKVLETLVPPAQASALVAAQLAAGSAAAIPGCYRDENTNEAYVNPMQQLVDLIKDRMESPIDQPGSRSLLFAFPAMTSPFFQLMYLKQNKGQNGEKSNTRNGDHTYIPAPDNLPGFPDATIAKSRTPYNGGVRRRWKIDKGKILEWDSQHGEVEMYDRLGNHVGSFDPVTGKKNKSANKNRSIKKYL